MSNAQGYTIYTNTIKYCSEYGILWTCHEDVILSYAVAVMAGTMGALTDSELLARPLETPMTSISESQLSLKHPTARPQFLSGLRQFEVQANFNRVQGLPGTGRCLFCNATRDFLMPFSE